MAAAKRVNSTAFNLMNAHLINLLSALDFQVYVHGQGLNVLCLHPKVVAAHFHCVPMVYAVLNAKAARITLKWIKITT